MVEKIRNFVEKHKLELLFCLYVCSFAIFLLFFVQRESDYFWHIKAGEYMAHHGILTKDVFSWYLSGKYWMSHEWLFEILLYGLKVIFPKVHILVYDFLFLTSLLLIIYFTQKKEILKNIPFGLLWIALSLILIPFIQGRPHLISFNLLALTIWVLYDAYKKEDSKLLYLMPIISILWANFHGGSSNLTYLFCFVFLIGGLFQFQFSKIEAHRITKKQIIKYLVVAILCMVCINLNIHGFKMFLYPYQNMMDSTMLNNIAEWIPTNLNNSSHYVYFGYLILILFIFLLSKKKIEFMDFILFGICVFLGLKSIRFWAYTYIIMSFVIFPYIGKRKMDPGTPGVLMILSGVLLLLFTTHTSDVMKQLNASQLTKKDIEEIRTVSPERLYNMYDYGGELVYAGIPVFIDGRADLYTSYNYEDYLDISMLQGDYVKMIQKYDFDYFFVNSKYPIATYLKYDSNYELVYKNKTKLLYKKRTNDEVNPILDTLKKEQVNVK